MTRSIASRTSTRRASDSVRTVPPEAGRSGNDVPGGAGGERRHRDDDGVERIGLAGDDLLQIRDHLGGHGDRVDGLVRVGPVAAAADDLEREEVGGRHDRAPEPPRRGRSRASRAGARRRRGRHRRRTPASTIAARAARRQLLGVLEDEAHLAGELVAPLDEDLGGAEQHRRVTVVAARVHDAGPRRDVRHVVLLEDRQARRCRLEARRPCPAARRAAARRPHVPGRSLDLEAAERAQGLLDEGGRLVLLERELGVRVQVAPPRDRTRFEIVRDESRAEASWSPSRLTLPGTSADRRG